jgi:hypothetical protein
MIALRNHRWASPLSRDPPPAAMGHSFAAGPLPSSSSVFCLFNVPSSSSDVLRHIPAAAAVFGLVHIRQIAFDNRNIQKSRMELKISNGST